MEAYLKKQDNGRYKCDEMELTCGDPIEVKTLFGWIMMRVEHDGSDYYLVANGLSFYPKKIYARYPR